MFEKILIANRGEIACRVIRTARRMGIATVAVYSEADRDALHVAMADEAVEIGPAPAAQSYLVIDNIIAACRRTGADAVHPGYGFLSEREAFAEALDAAGLVFIGPNRHAIAAMGDKIESKKAAAAAGVSTVPGYLGVIEDADEAVRIAGEIGYPIMIKASAGGGGKGMRIAKSEAEVAEGFRLARSEARSSFGDDRVFIEKFIVEPRHIEIQVLGDKHGNIIHLGERECSIQRRNQKVVEEAPSSFLNAKTRARMGAEAVALAKAVAYDSAGTVEFVVGQDKRFYFLEMNTRLQVEHPVTELVTGIDLVEQMIRGAAGERLALSQADIRLDGWAVESRIYAEDPSRNFLPSVGRLVTYRPPREGEENGVTVRNDTGVFEGGEISLHYDPMVAKLCTHAATREGAINAMADALDGFAIKGIRHNIPFLAALMQHPRWRKGRLSTGFIAEEFPDGFIASPPTGEEADLFVAVAAAIDHAQIRRRRNAMHAPPEQTPHVAVMADIEVNVIVEETDGDIRVALQDSPEGVVRHHVVSAASRPGAPVWHGCIDGKPISMLVRAVLGGLSLARRGKTADVRIYSFRQAELLRWILAKAPGLSAKALLCPMPGLVRSIDVKVGQDVRSGEPLCVVEAMKMENVLRAEWDGTVRTICVKPGDSLAVDAVVMEFD